MCRRLLVLVLFVLLPWAAGCDPLEVAKTLGGAGQNPAAPSSPPDDRQVVEQPPLDDEVAPDLDDPSAIPVELEPPVDIVPDDPVVDDPVEDDLAPPLELNPPVDDPQIAAPSGGSAAGGVFALRTGTALPQTLPSGTALGVSVTYEVVGSLNPSARYLLVVERNGGRPASFEFKPKQTGTLYQFVPGWQPTEGPFFCHIVELARSGQSRKVSPDERLR